MIKKVCYYFTINQHLSRISIKRSASIKQFFFHKKLDFFPHYLLLCDDFTIYSTILIKQKTFVPEFPLNGFSWILFHRFTEKRIWFNDQNAKQRYLYFPDFLVCFISIVMIQTICSAHIQEAYCILKLFYIEMKSVLYVNIWFYICVVKHLEIIS